MTAVQLQTRMQERTRSLQQANSELLLAIEKTEETTRRKWAFLANMSHELRTPLSSIIGFGELLQSTVFGPLTTKQMDYIDNILASGRYLLTLLNNLLDLSKIEAGTLAIRPEVFLLRDALEMAVHSVRPQADRKCQRIEFTIEKGLSWINADPLRFKQILFNLLSNAIKFTHEGGEIRIAASVVAPVVPERESSSARARTRTIIEIAITDTGIGIKPEDLSTLFQHFTQREATYPELYQGNRLGLALTKCLVELHGGSIRAYSDGAGRGSTFTIRLPQD